MGTTDVTVVIPVWDEYVRFVPEAVDSARQDDAGVRIVIVDNASEEVLPEITGVRLLKAPRRLSVGAARNLGLQNVETEFVLILDADDRLLPGALPLMRSRLDEDRSLSVCSTAILDGATGARHRFPRPSARALSRWPECFALANCVWSLYPIQSCALMRTADALEAGGYPDADWGDDWALGVSLAFRGRIELHRRPGRFYRAAPRSVSGESRTARDLLASARRVRGRIRSDPGIPRRARILTPLIAALQVAVVYALRPLYLALRRER